jgi:hypothetical protein
MLTIKFQKIFASTIIGTMIVVQVLSISSALLIPKPAEASFLPGIPDLEVIVGNLYDMAKDAGVAALKQVAIRYANTFLTRFINQLQEKYKIRNYLYYDQVLTNYYLSGYIRDKIADPDLRQIYSLLEAGYITGTYTGLNNQPNPNNALLVKLKNKIHQRYLDAGGIPTESITNPPADISNEDYYNQARLWSFSPTSFFEQDTGSQFAGVFMQASTASQLETIAGQTLKAGRVLSGTCTTGPGTPPIDLTQYTIEETCKAIGGVWKPSALNQVRDFINNPAGVIDKLMTSAINHLTDNQFDPNNYSAAIGSLIGDFLFNKLSDLGKDTLTEYPNTYTPDKGTGINPTLGAIDLDNDGVTDAYDTNADGQPDICVYGGSNGGSGPPCRTSSDAALPVPATPQEPLTSCTDKGVSDNYTSQLRNAAQQYVNANPSLATADSYTDTSAVAQVRDGAIAILLGQGFRAGTIFDPSGQPYYQVVAVGSANDADATVYRVTAGGGPVSQAINNTFCDNHVPWTEVH